ncbi:Gfo/Idh/MocA family protein [Paenibacillus thalictri]|uniref:Gfo/Idh/MocA family oxidoreductase n=1 Tax=Paenibacillus thalictri TaxID=2527873 RepID=A0A4Q9DQA7_9BACL|nr:Gfo/Idh/MocA family oxidoreductase [Paenibacillus thalictri]TBL78583.1 Gfo/Idh/MocA family oxidoreductase [Paenibacillus thalictri]
MKKLKIGFISFAHGHAFSYINCMSRLPEVEIVGIADDNESRVAEVAAKYGVPYFADYNELLQTDVDAVVICSENVYHAPITIAAARAKKHILCEKPLGTSTKDMEQMIRECRDHGVQLMTAFPCRYIPAVVQAKQAIDSGEIGDIVAIKGTNRGRMPGRWFIDKSLSGGGAVFDHTVHVMDLMHWFLGCKAVEVYGIADTLFNDVDIDDAGMVHAKFANGVVTVLDPSWSRSQKSFPMWGDVTMEIIGTKGVISVDGFAQKNELYSDQAIKPQWSHWGDDMDQYLVQAFVQALLTGTPVPITGEDGMNAAAVALAAYESARTGEPVRLD